MEKQTNKQKTPYIPKPRRASTGEDVEKSNNFIHTVDNVKWCSHFGRQLAFLQNVLHSYCLIQQFIPKYILRKVSNIWPSKDL